MTFANQHALKNELIQVLCEFLEGAIHTAVRARNIYNAEVFERQKLYNIFIGKSRNPQLNEYISSVVQNCKGLLEQGTLREVAVVFQHPSGKPVERVTLNIAGDYSAAAGLDIQALEQSLGSALLKLQFIDQLVRPLPPGCTFEVVVYCSSRQGPDMQFFCEDSAHCLELAQPVVAHPVKSLQVPGVLQLQLLVEEAQALKH